MDPNLWAALHASSADPVTTLGSSIYVEKSAASF